MTTQEYYRIFTFQVRKQYSNNRWRKINIAIFRKEATSAEASFHVGSPCRSNWNLEMLVFVEGGKLDKPEKNPQSRAQTNIKLSPHMTLVPGIKPRPHWREASALTTTPFLVYYTF